MNLTEHKDTKPPSFYINKNPHKSHKNIYGRLLKIFVLYFFVSSCLGVPLTHLYLVRHVPFFIDFYGNVTHDDINYPLIEREISDFT